MLADDLNRRVLKLIEVTYEKAFGDCLEYFGYLRPYMSLNEAYKIFTRKNVDVWLEEGLIDKEKTGDGLTCPYRINRSRIYMVAKMKGVKLQSPIPQHHVRRKIKHQD